MNATRSLVPTPSALATSTGSAMPAASRRNSPPNEPMSDSTPGVNVRARQRPDPPDDLVAGVDVDAGLLVVHQLHVERSELQPSNQRSATLARAAIRPAACPVRRRTSDEEALLLEDPPRACRSFAEQLDRGLRIAAALSSTFSISGVLRSATAPSASAIGARAGIARAACRARSAAATASLSPATASARQSPTPRRGADPGSRGCGRRTRACRR